MAVRGLGPTGNTNAVRNALRRCAKDPCECIGEAIERLVNGHDTGQGWNKGIMERIAAMLSPTADPPGTIFNGKDTWQTHRTQIQDRQRGLNNLKEEYDFRDCGSGGGGSGVYALDEAAVREALNAPVPTEQDYWDRYPESDAPGALLRVGAGVLGTVLLVGAAALVFVPFDGPVGEAAAGTAGIALWGVATQ